MRLGAALRFDHEDPAGWVRAHLEAGYTAAVYGLDMPRDDDAVRAYREAARRADLVIAEVGGWSNPLSAEEGERSRALEKCKAALDLADRVGARCAVNIAGSRGDRWDGPDPRDLTEETFDMIVQVVREIIDSVRPGRTYYALETMPWMYPDSADSYLRLIEAIDRGRFAVHFDPVNMVCSPRRYFNNAELVRDFVNRLGPCIRSCHAKDIILRDNLTTHLDEGRPGTGGLDYQAFLQAVDTLGGDTPVIIEHLSCAEEYAEAARYIREQAHTAGVCFQGNKSVE